MLGTRVKLHGKTPMPAQLLPERPAPPLGPRHLENGGRHPAPRVTPQMAEPNIPDPTSMLDPRGEKRWLAACLRNPARPVRIAYRADCPLALDSINQQSIDLLMQAVQRNPRCDRYPLRSNYPAKFTTTLRSSPGAPIYWTASWHAIIDAVVILVLGLLSIVDSCIWSWSS